MTMATSSKTPTFAHRAIGADIRARSPAPSKLQQSSSSSSSRKPTVTPLHQRILYPSPHGPRPPRILHSPAHTTLDPLILDLIALICREHIQSWYSGISRDPDRAFVQQATSIIIHVIQALEVRLAHVDLVELLVLDLPALLETHVRDWDQATDKARTGHAHNFDRDNVFHLLEPHIAVTLESDDTSAVKGRSQPRVDPTYLRALVDHLLRLLLPPEDYRAETERAIIREIVVNIIFGNVFNRVAQPWFLRSAITKFIIAKRKDSSPSRPTESTATSVSLVDRVTNAISSLPPLFRGVSASFSALYHTAVASPVPAHYRHQPPLTSPWISFLLVLLPSSPFLLQVTHYALLLITIFSSFITSLTFYLINENIFTSSLVESLLETATSAMFPAGRSPPKEEDPTLEQQDEIKRKCEDAVASILPNSIVSILVPELIEAESDDIKAHRLAKHLLRSLDSHVANVHLFALIIDLTIGKLFPELIVAHED